MRRLGAITVVSLLSVAMAGRAAAQVAGIPYYVNPRGGTGFSVAGNLGFGDGDKAYALTAGLGAGPLYITASAGQFNPDGPGDNLSTFGGTAGMKLFGGPLIPLTIGVQAGAGYYSSGSGTSERKLVSIPVAVGVGLNLPLFPLKPWIAPRVQFDRATNPSTTGSLTTNTTRMGISAGADFNLLLGLGFHAAVDYILEKDNSPSSTTFGVGAHFNFRVPMM